MNLDIQTFLYFGVGESVSGPPTLPTVKGEDADDPGEHLRLYWGVKRLVLFPSPLLNKEEFECVGRSSSRL